MKRNRQRLMVIISGLLFSLVGGCGYQFSGQSAFLPNDVRSVYVEPFINRSRDVGLENELTSALRSEFYRMGRLRMVNQPEQADAILSGVIRSLESHVASVNRRDQLLQYESAMILDVTLRRRQPEEIIWRAPGIRLTGVHAGSRGAVVTSSSEFRTGTLNASDVRRMTDVQLTEIERREMRDQLMERFARELHQRLMEMF